MKDIIWEIIYNILEKLFLCGLITLFFIIWIIGAIVTINWFIPDTIKEIKKASIQEAVYYH